MVKDKQEPIASVNLSYSDIELIVLALEQTPGLRMSNPDATELLQFMRRIESRLFRDINGQRAIN